MTVSYSSQSAVDLILQKGSCDDKVICSAMTSKPLTQLLKES